ncbi:putative quinonprotein alcohol dehydrogenase-like protein [metagenome]|uniref:Putative quinonprotein alcohol dehydrogenase-like protein n=1 Tax=metagenome TaxID=256318 RepID=A0A2P2C063_9ZZZZ
MRPSLRLASAAIAAALIGSLTAVPATARVVDPAPLQAPTFNKMVHSIVHSGSTVYVGGNFGTVTDANGTYARHGVAAYNADTGLVLPWNPDVHGLVYAVAVRNQSVFLGGAFDAVGGQPRSNLARVSATTGQALKGLRKANGAVRAIAATKKQVLVGGDFTKLGSARRVHLAGFTSSGKYRLNGWHPRATGGTVYTIQPTKGGAYVGGTYKKLNGKKAFGRISRINPVTGKLVKGFNPPVTVPVYDIAATPRRVYVAMGGPGGGSSGSFVTKTGKRKWLRSVNGDAQTISVLSGSVYVGGHFTRACLSSGTLSSGECTGSSVMRGKIMAITLKGTIRSFAPQIDSQFGLVAMDVFPSRGWLAVGGTFNFVDNDARGKFAVFG